MKKTNKNSESVQTAPEQKIIEIANECASEVWGEEYMPIFKLENLEKGGVTIRVCGGDTDDDWYYSLEIEGGEIVYLYIHKSDTSLSYWDMRFIKKLNERADEITEATFETEVA